MSGKRENGDADRARGDRLRFDGAWQELERAGRRYHFRRGRPANQVQYAFQNHWRVFRDLIGPTNGAQRPLRALEVGCGRGSMAAFFADAGYATDLLDYSPEAVRTARQNFASDGLNGRYVAGDVNNLPYADDVFDAIASIGLLEHFEDLSAPMNEQMRVLRPGGMLLAYVVPERPNSVQRLAVPVNRLLAALKRTGADGGRVAAKPPLYRNAFASSAYLDILRAGGHVDCGAFGMFPVPLVSHSPDFPFSPMSPALETALMAAWRGTMAVRKLLYSKDPWICEEEWGLAFLVWARKSAQHGIQA